jgi:hypothetical protein
MEDTRTAYSELAAYLGAKKSERPWGNNTRVRQAFDHIIVRLHNTDIANLSVDGSITLNTDGWQTATTKDRLNKVLALAGGKWRAWSEKGMWMLHYGGWAKDTPSYAFADRVTVWPDGRIEGQASEPPTKLRKAAKAYVNKLVAALFDGSLPAPDSGDCRFCRGMFGDVAEHDDDHIKSHIEEGYLVPTLLWNVITADDVKMGPLPKQYAQEIIWRHGGQRYANLDDVTARQLKRAVWVYIATRIGLPT